MHPIVNEILLTLDVIFHTEIMIVHASTALTFRERNSSKLEAFVWILKRILALIIYKLGQSELHM